MTDRTFTLIDDATGQRWTLPAVAGTRGPAAVDIRKLYARTGHFAFDPAFTSTASCKSRITFIDGEAGVLAYRGYDITDLAEHANFLEVAYLLLYGDLPTAPQKQEFETIITRHTMVHEQILNIYRGFRRDAHPMAVLCGVVGALSAFYHDSLDIRCARQREISAHRLISKIPTLAAMAYKYSIGQPFVYPRNDLSYAANFLHMCFAVPAEPYEVSPVAAAAMDKIFTLHADHEQNASTSTVRLAGSSGANPFACIAAGIASLGGPSHGGANEAVLEMLAEIGTPDRIGDFLARARDPDDPFRLMGFGHRVYKSYAPRAEVLKAACHAVLDDLGAPDDPLLPIALELERIALSEPYFVERGLYPNVDFYSGIILKALGFPPSMFTVLFALARTTGWVAQWTEMMQEPSLRIGRPRQVYTGAGPRPFVPIGERG